MAGHFAPDQQLCRRYAGFAADLQRGHFLVLYWIMFIGNLSILFFASWIYIKAQEALELHPGRSRMRLKALRKALFADLLCVAVSTVVVIMEAFALLALQFCDGEDLMSLYWSTWTMIQVGALIAMSGIVLALVHSLRDSKHPPWALAMGTPVLVIAGVLHLFHQVTKKNINKIRRKASSSASASPSTSKESEMSNDMEESVERVDDAEPEWDSEKGLQAEVIGSTTDGGMIVRFLTTQPGWASKGGQLLGKTEDERPIVAFAKGVVTFEAEP
ncbi:hypothetical protein GQ602_001597 [Ophiocordyceps camponoti-floridani]|uniref:Uncharacterized protein n=1 Tax=Ophiocordyceps camponoti-floridani TaxID=2030778 RepID=A0A8H4QED9_9HYPO|nr:hypothetical protein GQ602_001597 [Ophiocordyceps camponoti-floridani]